jgi:hypothetical protein
LICRILLKQISITIIMHMGVEDCRGRCFLIGLWQGHVKRVSKSCETDKYGYEFCETWNQEWLCRQSPAAFYLTDQCWSSLITQSEPWDRQIWSWVPWDLEPRITGVDGQQRFIQPTDQPTFQCYRVSNMTQSESWDRKKYMVMGPGELRSKN